MDAASVGNIITYSALSRRGIEFLYRAAVAVGAIVASQRVVVRFLTGLEVAIEGLLPGSLVADLRKRLAQARPLTIGYKYQLFCNERLLPDDELLDGTIVYGATIVPSKLCRLQERLQEVMQERILAQSRLPIVNWVREWYELQRALLRERYELQRAMRGEFPTSWSQQSVACLGDHRFKHRRLPIQSAAANAPQRRPNLGAKVPRGKGRQSWGRGGRK